MRLHPKSEVYLQLITGEFDLNVDFLLNVPTVEEANKWAEENLPYSEHLDVAKNNCGVWVSGEYVNIDMPDMLFKGDRKTYAANIRNNSEILKAIFHPLVKDVELEDIL